VHRQHGGRQHEIARPSTENTSTPTSSARCVEVVVDGGRVVGVRGSTILGGRTVTRAKNDGVQPLVRTVIGL